MSNQTKSLADTIKKATEQIKEAFKDRNPKWYFWNNKTGKLTPYKKRKQ